MTDTIFAPATAAGRAAVAVIRISGPESAKVLQQLAAPLPAPRRAALRRLKAGDDILDEALVLWLPGPTSFTGEDSAELHLHGGRASVEAVSRALADLGLRLAEPGEFSRRAFQNGKLDLTQAEAIADLVDAETDAATAPGPRPVGRRTLGPLRRLARPFDPGAGQVGSRGRLSRRGPARHPAGRGSAPASAPWPANWKRRWRTRVEASVSATAYASL